jgi:DNA polymerase IV
VAKIASEIKKPDGLTFIGPSKITSFMESLPVEKFFGVGKVTAAKMKEMGMFTGKELKKYSVEELVKHFGKNGNFYYQIVRGIDDRQVEPNRETKSLSAEDTFPYDLTRLEDMNQELDKIAALVEQRLLHYGLKGRTVTLKIKFSDFKIITPSKSYPHPVNENGIIASTARQLLEETAPEGKQIRLLGISLSNFGEPDQKQKNNHGKDQLLLFPPSA